LFEAGEEGARGKDLDPGGGELDGEGETVEAAADVGDDGGNVGGQAEGGVGGLGALDEEGDGTGAGDLVEGGPV
jgi:hypothetical protein